MDLMKLLREHEDEIVNEAIEALSRTHLKRYETETPAETDDRLRVLYDLTVQSLVRREVGPLLQWAVQVAKQRHAAGYDLYDVQVAINVLEESLWNRLLAHLDPREFAQAIGLVSTVLGLAKDAVAREFVSLAAKTKAPSLDLKALFGGTEDVER